MHNALKALLVAVTLVMASQAVAADRTPAGTWIQVDDATAKPKSIIDITQLPDGTLEGVVEQVLVSSQGTHPICTACSGKRHDQPVDGMVIMWGVKRDGSTWDGGQILDPVNGKVYKVKLTLVDGGQKLDVRGYVGLPFLGRTETWLRKTD